VAAHSYWQIIFPAAPSARTSSTQQITELEFHTSVGGAQAATGGTATGFALTPSGTPANAFDGNTGTVYGDTGATTNTMWGIGYSFATPVDIVEIVLKIGASPATGPVNYIVRYSDNGSSWVNQYAASTTWAANESKTILVSANVLGTLLARPDYNQLAYTHTGSYGTLFPRAISTCVLPNGNGFTRTQFKGSTYKVQGTTTQLGVPTARKVWLVDQASGLLVDSVATDSTGAFVFNEILPGTYSVIGVNPTGVQNSVIYAHIAAVPM
jgi:hypothetical protein